MIDLYIRENIYFERRNFMEYDTGSLSEQIIDKLCEFRGFDNLWFNAEDEYREQIIYQVQEVIREFLDEERCSCN